MKKTLAEIMAEPATVEAIIREALAINKLIEDSKEAGIEWPKLEEEHTEPNPDDYELIRGRQLCAGCSFLQDMSCSVPGNPKFDCGIGGIFVKKEHKDE